MAHVPNYYAQRRPTELSRFQWVVDAKDKLITPQEAWWKDMLGPLIQAETALNPLPRVNDPRFNYRYYHDNSLPAGVKRQPNREFVDIEVGTVVTKNLSFEDSKADILIQTIDVLCNYTRRVLEGRVTDPDAVRFLGRIQIAQSQDGISQPLQIIAFHDKQPKRSDLGAILKDMNRAARIMMVPDPKGQ